LLPKWPKDENGLQPRQPGEHPYRAADADGKEQGGMSTENKIKWLPGREKSEYQAEVSGIRFYIYHASDAGFGLAATRLSDSKHLNSPHGISWCRTKKRCVAYAENILAAEMVRMEKSSEKVA
jgi:hypothetical protein